MVSYKKLYLEQLEFSKSVSNSDYFCPICESRLLESLSELYCSNENCEFDKTFTDLVFSYAVSNGLKRVD